mmetsp:Transcript_24270/g.53057  ORF Transcript_24270/g.53057 Transcript_24270/m.53057 type:complete len:308 (-) Transcript_24270:1150-2073(-)
MRRGKAVEGQQHVGPVHTTTAAQADARALAQHVWDGRLLEPGQETSAQLRRNSTVREIEHSNTTVIRGPKLANAARAGAHGRADAHPMTPPRVSGISLAPIPDTDCGSDIPAVSSQRPSQTHITSNLGPHPHAAAPDGGGAGRGQKRPPMLKIPGAGGLPGGLVAPGAYGPHAPDAAAGKQQAEVPQLMAEGKGLVRSHAPRASSNGSAANPYLLYYQEINETDSLCGTPPAISVEAVTREFDGKGPLGPLTPAPLSPSILTICGGLEAFEFDRGSATSASGCLWSPDTSCRLPDMRQCESPQIPSA